MPLHMTEATPRRCYRSRNCTWTFVLSQGCSAEHYTDMPMSNIRIPYTWLDQCKQSHLHGGHTHRWDRLPRTWDEHNDCRQLKDYRQRHYSSTRRPFEPIPRPKPQSPAATSRRRADYFYPCTPPGRLCNQNRRMRRR